MKNNEIKDVNEYVGTARNGYKAKKLNEDKNGACEYCGREALLSKGYGPKFACEACYYLHGQERPKK